MMCINLIFLLLIGACFQPNTRGLNSGSFHRTNILRLSLGGKNYGLSGRIVKPITSISVPEPEVKSTAVIGYSTNLIDSITTDDEVLISKIEIAVETEVLIPEAVLRQDDPITTFSNDVTEAIEVEISTPELSAEEKLRLRINKETVTRNERMKGLSLLQKQLSKSVARKQEVEQMLIKEVVTLRNVIDGEIEGEAVRLGELESLYTSFRDLFVSKTVLLDSEVKILEQMKAVRDMVNEQVVLVQLDSAILKKGELISIEKTICADIKTCLDEVNAEISETKSKIVDLQSVLLSLPSSTDEAGYAARSYSWEEIESLEQKLIQSVESSAGRDKRIIAFGEVFDNVLKRKGLILGENTAIPSDIEVTIANAPGITATTVTENDEELDDVANLPAKKTMSLQELTEILKQQNQAEVAATAVEAIRRGSQSIFTATGSVLGASVTSFKSTEAEESRKAFTVAVEAAKNVVRSFKKAWNTAKTVWSNELGDESKIETTDEYFKRAGSAINNIAKSEDLKESLASAAESTVKSTKEIGAATSLIARKIGSELGESDSWNKAVSDLGSSFSVLLAAVTATASKVVLNQQERLLPPSKR